VLSILDAVLTVSPIAAVRTIHHEQIKQPTEELESRSRSAEYTSSHFSAVQTGADSQVTGIGAQMNFQTFRQRLTTFHAFGSKSCYRYGVILLME
jgi:hypothetical protein